MLFSAYPFEERQTAGFALDTGWTDPLVRTSHLKLLYPPSPCFLAPWPPSPVDESLLLSHDPPLLVVVSLTSMALPLLEASSDLKGFLVEEPSFSSVFWHSADPWAHPPFSSPYAPSPPGTCICGAHSIIKNQCCGITGPCGTLITACTHHRWPHISPPQPFHQL